MRIFQLRLDGTWKEERNSAAVLYANTQKRPYGFVVPRGASRGQTLAVVTAPEGPTGGAASSSGAAADDIVTIHVKHEGIVRSVRFNRTASSKKVRQAIRDAFWIKRGTWFRLNDMQGAVMIVNNQLAPDSYDLELPPS